MYTLAIQELDIEVGKVMFRTRDGILQVGYSASAWPPGGRPTKSSVCHIYNKLLEI